jgi:hypothetical protein
MKPPEDSRRRGKAVRDGPHSHEVMKMRKRYTGMTIAGTAAVLAAAILLSTTPISGQAPRPYRAPRTADGKPNLNGTWQALNTANWDIEDHVARQGPVIALGASFSVPPGVGVVEGGELPYRPEALSQKKENAANWMTRDPEIKCYLPGIPRATYQGYPFQIVQTPQQILMAYEFANASRIVYMNSTEESPSNFWMGWSRGHWEGETLVIDVTGFDDQTWFDRAGNFHSDALHVTERYTATGPDHLLYEATIDDPKTFTRPWKMSMPLYRRMEKNAQLLEYLCVEFAEELMYGHLSKRPTK